MKPIHWFLIAGGILLISNLKGKYDMTTEKWITPENGLEFEPLFKLASAQYNIPDGLLSRMAYQESNYDPNAESPVGAKGLMQFMDATAEDFGINPWDAEQSIYAAARYMRQLYNKTGSWTLALAAYNWGIGNVLRIGLDAAPDETVNYYRNITRDTGIS